MPAGSQDPVPSPSSPVPGPGPAWEDQERVLAELLEAFPPEDEPDWGAVERLEYFGDGAGGEGSWPVDLPGPVPGEHPGSVGDEQPAALGSAAPGPPGVPAPPRSAVPDAAAPGSAAPGAVAPDPAVPGGSRVGAWFADGGVADVMPPGPRLAALAGQVCGDDFSGLGGLDDDELAGMLAAQARLAARAAAGQLAVISQIAARHEAQARASGDWRGFEHAQDEIALTLTLTRPAAGWRLALALALALNRLPLTRAALATGQIDERRAAVIADEISGLDDGHAAAVEAQVIGKAAAQTTGQLRPAVRRAVIAADPQAAKRRKDEALKDARVETYTSPSGTAALAGRDLPPAGVLAADKHLSALAKAMKKAGTPGTMDQLRARAYLHLLAGGTPTTLLTPPPATTGNGTPGSGTPGSGTPGDGTPGSSPTADGTPGDGTPGDGTTGNGSGAPDGAHDGAGTAGTGGPASSSAGGTAAGSGAAGRGAAGSGPAGGGAAGGGAAGAPGLGLPALRGTVNLTMPLAAWLGWTQSPGQVPGFGVLDAEDSRALAAMLAHDPATQWCLTLTDPAGHAIAHGCAKHGPPPGPGRERPGSRAPGRPRSRARPGAASWARTPRRTRARARANSRT